MIEGYELSKYLDPVTVRIMNFIHKAKCLYTCTEDNNSKVLKYSYLNLCTYNRESEEQDYIDLLAVNFANYNMMRETSNWTIEYNQYAESIRRKCNWCDVKSDFCPIKVYADLKNYANHNKLDIDKLMEKLVDEPVNKTISNEVLERNVANKVIKLCSEFSDLRIAQLLIETKTVKLMDAVDNIVKYNHIDLKVNSDSLINNLYNYYTGMGNTIEERLDLDNLEDNKKSTIYECSPYKVAAYVLYLCAIEKLNPKKVLDRAIYKCGNIAESKFNTYYKWYIYQINNLDCEQDVKKELIEILTYIRNYHIKYQYHLPYIQLNINLQIEDESLLEKMMSIIYRFATSCGYIKEKMSIIDTEFLYNKCEKDAEIINNIDKMYKDSGMIVIKEIEKISLSQSKMENLFYSIESSMKIYDRTITVIASKNDITNFIKGFPILRGRIRHNIRIDEYSLEKIQDKIINRLKSNYEVSKGIEENIKQFIEKDYRQSVIKNNDYIENLYRYIVYTNFNILNVSNELKEERIKYNRNKTDRTSKKNIEDLIGLEEIKREVQKFRNLLIFNKKISNKLENKNMNMNMLFLGNPGTGKTTVASIMADILYELGYIKKNKFIDVTAKDLVAEYVGQTAIKTSRIIENALDGVLFIDEAYSIVSANKNASFGEESIATLVQAMEKYKDRLVVIFAGYTLEMKNFLDSNPGIASRIGYTFEFSNYTTEELIQILDNYALSKGFTVEEEAKKGIIEIIEVDKNTRNFGNARFMINLFERLVMVHAQDFDENNLMTITKKDVVGLRNESFSLKKSTEEIQGELARLVGLNNVKKELDGLIDLVMLNNKLEKRIPLNLNMIFIGNPGTGKTTVARIFAEILYNLGYIKNNKLIEVTGKDLIGEYVGQTSNKTAKVLENALDGLLFIDEAYTLMNQAGNNGNYSQDAISTITKYMTDYEGRITIIFAGYKEEMKEFLELNSGLISRVGETIEFGDYSEEELLTIFKKEAEKSEFTIDKNAEEAILSIIKENIKTKNFGNARFVINVFKKTLMQHAKRCREIQDMKELKTITIEDIPEIEIHKEKRIGF
ncbi:MAG: AAA family ATPase [Clostridia bacterium]|nr:AAA family ATPase [Clostridia bacterium]